jgi:hypothetical protein
MTDEMRAISVAAAEQGAARQAAQELLLVNADVEGAAETTG